MSSTVLAIYRLIGTGQLKDFLASPSEIGIVKPPAPDPASAHPTMDSILAYDQGEPHEVDWVSKAQQVFNNVPLLFSQTARGVVVLIVKGMVFAIPFGPGGSSLLDQSKIMRGWGRRAALNLLYDAGGALLDKGHALRKGRRAQFGRGLVTEVQSSEEVALEALGFDRAQEILRAVTVAVKRTGGGRHVEGNDSFRLRWSGNFSNLSEICLEIEEIHQRLHYKKDFSFIDDLSKVGDLGLVKNVWSEVVSRISSGTMGGLGLTPPVLLDLVGAEVDLFGVTNHAIKGGHRLSDFGVSEYASMLSVLGVLPVLDVAELKKHRIRVCVNGVVAMEEHVFALLEGVVNYNAEDYVLNEGDVYAVSRRFVDELDDFIDGIDAVEPQAFVMPRFGSVPLRDKPNRKKKTIERVRDERAFNIEVAKAFGGLCLDGDNVVTIPSRTTTVEICDVLMPNKELIHTKIGVESATLSHLFAQAATSAELLLDSQDFRKEARLKVRQSARRDGKNAVDFDSSIPLSIRNGSMHNIALVIISKKWGSGTVATAAVRDVIPFFSKINIRSAVTRMRARAFSVRIARVLT